MIFEPFTLKHLKLKNRIIRSSIGGRFAFYDGTVSPAFQTFERRFAEGGVAALISATLAVDDHRWSPIEYPKISHDRFIAPIRKAIDQIHALDCHYIIQIGDPGAHCQTSLFPQTADTKSASTTFDLLYGYGDRSTPMTQEDIERTIDNFRQAARRCREANADGVEVTISKGYLLHQFLNPATNRRSDEYGGSVEKRFRLIEEVLTAVRDAVGDDYLVGVRQSATDYNWQPLNLRWPPTLPLRHYFMGNGLEENLSYARNLEAMGIDYIHVDSGFGFVNPNGNPGEMPVTELRMFANATRHLSRKARLRSWFLNTVPRPLMQQVFNMFGKRGPEANASFSKAFKAVVSIPIIANGGFQERSRIERVLSDGSCDLVSMARPLLANRELLEVFKAGNELPDRPCTQCGRCCIVTALLPVGCYDRSRFDSQDEMEAEIIRWLTPPEQLPAVLS